jgi:hypothetical protein
MANAVFGRASYGAATVTTAPTPLGAPLGNRENIVIYNADPNVTMYVGTDASVTTATGFPILPNSSLSLDFGPQIPIFGIVAAGSISARFMEAY